MNIRSLPALAPILVVSVLGCVSQAHARPDRRPEQAVAALARAGRIADPARVRWSKVRSEKHGCGFFFTDYDAASGVGDLWVILEQSGEPRLLAERTGFHLTLTSDGRLFFVGSVGPHGTGELSVLQLPRGRSRPVDQGVSRFGLDLDDDEQARAGVYLGHVEEGRGELHVLDLDTMRAHVLARRVTDFRVASGGGRVLFVDDAPGGDPGALHAAPLPLAGPVADLGPAHGLRVPNRVVAAR